MDAVTYPNNKVGKFIMDHMVPMRVPYDEKPLSFDFSVTWTPTILTLDSLGKEHQRTVGFLAPDEFIPSLMLGIAKVCSSSGNYSGARHFLEMLLKDYGRSDAVPEALYHRGVNFYKEKGDPKELKKAYELLQKEYPASIWAKRAAPYRLL
jgi:hypothetical protein